MYHGRACLYTDQCRVHGNWRLAGKWISHVFNITGLLLDFARCQGGIKKKESIFAIRKIFDENQNRIASNVIFYGKSFEKSIQMKFILYKGGNLILSNEDPHTFLHDPKASL